MKNSYLSIARLSTHPAFSFQHNGLKCPCCQSVFDRTRDYDKHFLAHNPTNEQAWKMLSGKTFDRESKKRGWREMWEIESQTGKP